MSQTASSQVLFIADNLLNPFDKCLFFAFFLFFRRPMPSPDSTATNNSFFSSSSSKSKDDMETGRTAHTSKANFKPSSSNEVLSYATMPRGGDKKDLDFQRWRNVEENNNENAFSSYKGLFIKKKSSQSRMTLAIFVKGNIKKIHVS